jgi:hypothetical protein
MASMGVEIATTRDISRQILWIDPAKVLTRHIPPACSGDSFVECLPSNLTGNSFSSIHYPDVHFTVKLETVDEKPGIRCFPASVSPEKAEGGYDNTTSLSGGCHLE